MRMALIVALMAVSLGAASAEEINSLPGFYTSTGFGTLAFNEEAANVYQAQKVFKRYNPIVTESPDGLTKQATNCYVFNHHSKIHEGKPSFVYIRIEKYDDNPFRYNLRIQRNKGWVADRRPDRMKPIDTLFAGPTAEDFEAAHNAKCKDGEHRQACEKRLLDEIEAIFGDIHGRPDVNGERTFKFRQAYTMDNETSKNVFVDHLFHRFTVTARRTSRRMPAFCHNNSFSKIRITTFSPLGGAFVNQFEIIRD